MRLFALLAVALVACGGASQSDAEKAAATEVRALGLGEPSNLREMRGRRDTFKGRETVQAVCGSAGGKRLIYRPGQVKNRLIVEGSRDWPPEQFALLWPRWCVEGDHIKTY